MTAITHTYKFTGAGEDFGPRQSGLVILHTTESVKDRNTVKDGMLVAAWQDRDDKLGSYNRLICSDGVISTVPDNHASGGTNPFSTYFDPVSWLYQFLPANVVNNPNAYALQLSAVGAKAHFDTVGWPQGIIDGFAKSIIDEEKRIGRGVVVANHADFQPGNRSDAGSVAMNLVMKRYEELMMPDEPTATFLDVPETSRFYKDITWVDEKGIMGGVSATAFKPSDPLTRGQAAAVLHRLYNVIQKENQE